MTLLQQPIQRKLSALLGAEVTFEKLHLSILSGSIEATGMVVSSGAGAPPVLTVARITAQVAIAKALKGELIISSMQIEKPALRVIRRADGTSNLPRCIRPTAGDRAAPQPATQKSRWQLEAENVHVLDGSASLVDESVPGGAYEISALPLDARLTRIERGYELTMEIDRVVRAGAAAPLDGIRARARFDGAAAITLLGDAALDARMQIADILTATVTSPGLASKAFELQCHGAADAKRLIAWLPAGWMPHWLVPMAGNLSFEARAKRDRAGKLCISELNVRAADVSLPG